MRAQCGQKLYEVSQVISIRWTVSARFFFRPGLNAHLAATLDKTVYSHGVYHLLDDNVCVVKLCVESCLVYEQPKMSLLEKTFSIWNHVS